MDARGEIVRLKVRLLGISPMIWRRVLVRASMTLRELHGVVQIAMGWESIHLFAFEIGAVQYGPFDLHMASANVAISQFDFRQNARFSYRYDMGDNWAHEVRVEGFATADPKQVYPVCTGGSGACPPEECGGPQGYLERRDEAGGYGAWRDMGVMVEWLDDILHRDIADKTVGEVATDDARMAMERMAARGPFLSDKFSRKLVNQAFRDGRHRDLMHQQFI